MPHVVRRQIEEVIHTPEGEKIERTILEWVEATDDECSDSDTDTDESDSSSDSENEEDEGVFELDDHDLGIEDLEVPIEEVDISN